MLVGRTDELRRLDDRVTDAVEGSGGALLVTGGPGAGVTAVLDAVARRSAPRARVLRVRAFAGSEAGALLHDLARAAGVPRPRTDSVDAVVDALQPDVAGLPAVLLVDDAHLADPRSCAALAEVVARTPGLLALVGWQRGPDPVPDAVAGWDRLGLGPLDDEASLALARAALGCDAPRLPALVARLHGNARALREIPPRLPGDVLVGRAPIPDPLPVPEALLAAWSRWLPEQGSDVDEALLLAALCVPAPPGAGVGVLDDDVRAVLVSSGVCEAAADVAWVEPWLREVVVARARTEARRRAHRALSAAAAAHGAAPSVVAHHLDLSAAGTDDEVADALEEQARRAELLGLPDVVSTTWAAAALRSGEGRRRVERAVEGARTLTATGPGMDAVDDLLRVLEDAELGPEQAAVRDRLRALKRGGLDPGARVVALQTSAEHARSSAPRLLPDLLWELSVLSCQHGEPRVGVAAAEEYRALQSAGGVPDAPAWAGTALLSAALFQAGEIAESERLRRVAHESAESLDPAEADLDLLFNAVALDDLVLDLSPRATERLLHLVQRLDGEAYPVACLYGIQGWRARARGDLVTARRMLRHGLDVALPQSAVDVACGLGALAAELSAIQGDDELERSALGMRALMQSTGDLRRLSTLDRALGLRAVVGGRLDEAVVHLSAAAAAPMLGRGLRDGVLMARVDLVEALLRADDREGALDRASPVLDVLDQMDDALAHALACRLRGLLALDDEESVRLLQDALTAHGESLDLFERARTHLLRGERLRRMRRRGEARLDLLEAARRFEHLGADPWAARAHAELRACGGGATRDPDVDLRVLTPQELAVATAVAHGASNREVAESLFLSARTVEYHLGNVYRKLGVHGRGALGATLLRDGALS